jgi:hypothetical protein
MSVTPAVFYLSTKLAGCSVDPGTNRGARKLARTSRIKKKNLVYLTRLIRIILGFCFFEKKMNTVETIETFIGKVCHAYNVFVYVFWNGGVSTFYC